MLSGYLPEVITRRLIRFRFLISRAPRARTHTRPRARRCHPVCLTAPHRSLPRVAAPRTLGKPTATRDAVDIYLIVIRPYTAPVRRCERVSRCVAAAGLSARLIYTSGARFNMERVSRTDF